MVATRRCCKLVLQKEEKTTNLTKEELQAIGNYRSSCLQFYIVEYFLLEEKENQSSVRA